MIGIDRELDFLLMGAERAVTLERPALCGISESRIRKRGRVLNHRCSPVWLRSGALVFQEAPDPIRHLHRTSDKIGDLCHTGREMSDGGCPSSGSTTSGATAKARWAICRRPSTEGADTSCRTRKGSETRSGCGSVLRGGPTATCAPRAAARRCRTVRWSECSAPVRAAPTTCPADSAPPRNPSVLQGKVVSPTGLEPLLFGSGM